MRVTVEDGLEPPPDPGDLRRPLLGVGGGGGDAPAAAAETPPVSPSHGSGCCSTAGGVSNIVVTAVGAGMVALPRAVSEVGILAGAALFAICALLTFASTRIIVTYAAQRRVQSYADLVRAHFGDRGAALLQLSIIVHVGGVMIGYCVIISDVLVGAASTGYTGVLPTLLGRHDGPWWLSRAAVLGACLAGVAGPMLVPRSLAGVARFSRFSVAMVACLAAAICGLAAAAVAEGRVAPSVRLLPDPGGIRGGGPLGVAAALLTVVSVSLLAYTCHFNLIPVQRSLRDPSAGHMARVLRLALAACAAIYVTVGLSGYALFGAETSGDVLMGLTAEFAGGLLPAPLAAALVYFIALAFTFNLLVNFTLKVWAVRESLCELLLGMPAHRLTAAPHYGLTAALAGAAYAASLAVPSIYALLALVGSTACATFSLFFPAALVWRCRAGDCAARACACALAGLGAAMATMAVYNQLHGLGE